MGTFLLFLFSFLRPHKKHKNTHKQTKIKNAHKKHLRGKKSLIRLFVFLCFSLVVSLCFLCFLCHQNLFVKKKKKFKTALINSCTLLVNLSYYKHDFFLITIFFNYHNLFELSKSFSIITTFLNHHNLFQSLYNLWHYLYENKPVYKSHHLTHIFYHQDMAKIFC